MQQLPPIEFKFQNQPPHVQSRIIQLLRKYNTAMNFDQNDKLEVDIAVQFDSENQRNKFLESYITKIANSPTKPNPPAKVLGESNKNSAAVGVPKLTPEQLLLSEQLRNQKNQIAMSSLEKQSEIAAAVSPRVSRPQSRVPSQPQSQAQSQTRSRASSAVSNVSNLPAVPSAAGASTVSPVVSQKDIVVQAKDFYVDLSQRIAKSLDQAFQLIKFQTKKHKESKHNVTKPSRSQNQQQPIPVATDPLSMTYGKPHRDWPTLPTTHTQAKHGEMYIESGEDDRQAYSDHLFDSSSQDLSSSDRYHRDASASKYIVPHVIQEEESSHDDQSYTQEPSYNSNSKAAQSFSQKSKKPNLASSRDPRAINSGRASGNSQKDSGSRKLQSSFEKNLSPFNQKKFEEFVQRNRKKIQELVQRTKMDFKTDQKNSRLLAPKNKGTKQSHKGEKGSEQQSQMFSRKFYEEYQSSIIADNSNMSSTEMVQYFRYLIQHAKKLYVDYLKAPKDN